MNADPRQRTGARATNADPANTTTVLNPSTPDFTPPASKVDRNSLSGVHAIPDRDAAAVRDWCRPLLAAAGHVPVLGEIAWVTATDTVRLASLTRAALTWLDSMSTQALTVELAVQLARENDDTTMRLRAASHDLAGAVDWASRSRSPSHAELQRRRSAVVVSR